MLHLLAVPSSHANIIIRNISVNCNPNIYISHWSIESTYSEYKVQNYNISILLITDFKTMYKAIEMLQLPNILINQTLLS